MCPMLPDHNFLVSGAKWPTEKHIKKLGPSFSVIWRNLTFSVLKFTQSRHVSKQKMSNFSKLRKNLVPIFLYVFQLAILHHSPKNCARATSGTLILCFVIQYRAQFRATLLNANLNASLSTSRQAQIDHHGRYVSIGTQMGFVMT